MEITRKQSFIIRLVVNGRNYTFDVTAESEEDAKKAILADIEIIKKELTKAK
jgi:hypothetical protein